MAVDAKGRSATVFQHNSAVADPPSALDFPRIALDLSLLRRPHHWLALLDNKDRHHFDGFAADRGFIVNSAVRYLEGLANLVDLFRLTIDQIPEFTFRHVGEHDAWMGMPS